MSSHSRHSADCPFNRNRRPSISHIPFPGAMVDIPSIDTARSDPPFGVDVDGNQNLHSCCRGDGNVLRSTVPKDVTPAGSVASSLRPIRARNQTVQSGNPTGEIGLTVRA
jgi:hypothetical protein